jgi:DNA-binding transcriptional MerR regulator
MPLINLQHRAFNTKQVCALTGITQRQVTHWDKAGIVKPSLGSADGRGSRRQYSYMDLLAVKVVKSFRDENISLQKIRKCVQYLRTHLKDVSQPLSFCSLISIGESVFLIDDEQTLIDTVRHQGQRLFHQLCIDALDRELRAKVYTLETKLVETLTAGDCTYQVQLVPDHESGGYTAEVAGLPGCITQGETLEEVLDMAQDAIKTYLIAVEDLRNRGIKIQVEKKTLRRKHA